MKYCRRILLAKDSCQCELFSYMNSNRQNPGIEIFSIRVHTKVKIYLLEQNKLHRGALHACIGPKHTKKANVRLKMLEVKKLGASSPAAGKMLAAVVNPATAAFTLSAPASTAGKYFSKVT